MSAPRAERIAALFVVVTGSLWGIYWVPVRQLESAALPGAWGSFVVAAVATLLMAPVGWRYRARLAQAGWLEIAAILLGGAAFVMYSVGLVYGRVAIVILLFYLTPVWSTLIGRLWLGWPTPWLRYLAILIGLIGLLLVLGADGGVPLPRSIGDWLGLASGLLWSISSTGIRTRSRLGAGETTFVFIFGSLVAALVLALTLSPRPALPSAAELLPTIAWVLAAAVLWWALSLAALLWAATRLEPARLGILLMSEVLVGVFSAALFAGEQAGAAEMVGGALVVAAAVLEVWPVRTPDSVRTNGG